ncbi:hypothetical protein AMAG_01670 [Allomyces macrogynus ATCC 38327]|uniref:G-patch domain-containing protein n=1 Tax=Allomyces macrogynus (strain ATCC 38327) TaxID=578462 RepID=A0A0L0RZE9_ALLM3|nr:hypothetical protein AMAG_01670 [Allomyces macrogynus ATCC 38327]|eukprot:KNE55797.1 hypothetical protein AMAG_01670 [Allomyces macrogynus ATCC 38327]
MPPPASSPAPAAAASADPDLANARRAFATDLKSKVGLVVNPTKRQRLSADDGAEPAKPLVATARTDLSDRDLAALPDLDTAQYESVAVTDFGTAMLKGMGWREGDVIGRNKEHALAKPIEYIPRPSLLGLGAQPANAANAPSLKRKQRPDYELPTTADGKVRHYKAVDETLRERLKMAVGAFVRIDHGKHRGLLGIVTELRVGERDRVVRVELHNGERIKVDDRDVKLLTTEEYNRERKSGRSSRSSRDDPDERPSSSSSSTRPSSSSSSTAAAPPAPAIPPSSSSRSGTTVDVWVRPGLRVRIVSKSLAGGKYYEKKGRIVDVLPGGLSVLKIEGAARSLVDQVPQRGLETIMPAVGNTVMIVRAVKGPDGVRDAQYVGQCGQVLERDRKRQQGVVQLDDGEVVVGAFDDLCEVGAGE